MAKKLILLNDLKLSSESFIIITEKAPIKNAEFAAFALSKDVK